MGIKMFVIILQIHPWSWWVILMTSCTTYDAITDDSFTRKFLKMGMKLKLWKFFEQAIKMTYYTIKMQFIAYLADIMDSLTWFPIEWARIKFLLMTSYFDHDVIEMTNFDRKWTQASCAVILISIKALLKQDSGLSYFVSYDYQLFLGSHSESQAGFFREWYLAICASNKP